MKSVGKACCRLVIRYHDTTGFICRATLDECVAEVTIEYVVEPGGELPDFMWLRKVIRDVSSAPILAEELACEIYNTLKRFIKVRRVVVKVYGNLHGPAEVIVGGGEHC